MLRRKLPCNQNLQLNLSSVDPDLVNRSAGSRDPGHQYQLTALDRADISMILVPLNMGSPAGLSLVIILSMILESPMNTGTRGLYLLAPG